MSANARDVGSIPGTGRFPGEGNRSPLQYSYLGSPMDREAWWAIVHELQRVRYDLATTQHDYSQPMIIHGFLWLMNFLPHVLSLQIS